MASSACLSCCQRSPTTASGIRFISNPQKEVKDDGYTRFVCFSDTHGLHTQIPKRNMPQADVLLHAGDFTNTGELEDVKSFSDWLLAYPADIKIVIAGNHDTTFEPDYYESRGAQRFHGSKPYDCSIAKEMLKGCIYLEDSMIDVNGFQIYGSPYQPEFGDWAFNLPKGEACKQKWEQIPSKTDILMTHGPAFGHGDLCRSNIRAGCEELLQVIDQRNIPIHVFGHIHSGYGITSNQKTTFINASTCTSEYEPTNLPIVFDLPLKSDFVKGGEGN